MHCLVHDYVGMDIAMHGHRHCHCMAKQGTATWQGMPLTLQLSIGLTIDVLLADRRKSSASCTCITTRAVHMQCFTRRLSAVHPGIDLRPNQRQEVLSISSVQGVRILQLDIGLLLAGSRERGAIETRVTEMVSELTASAGSIILVIDEIHTLVGAGSVGHGGVAGGGLDLANLLKPALSGSMQCIGATTLDEHRARFEKDPALNRRFQPVLVREPTQDEALEVRPPSDLHVGPILLQLRCFEGCGSEGCRANLSVSTCERP